MTRPAEGPGTPLEPPGNRWPRWMAIQDRIRLTGLLRKKPRQQGFFYGQNAHGSRREIARGRPRTRVVVGSAPHRLREPGARRSRWPRTATLAATLAERLGLGADLHEPMRQIFARWDGKGEPGLKRRRDSAGRPPRPARRHRRGAPERGRPGAGARGRSKARRRAVRPGDRRRARAPRGRALRRARRRDDLGRGRRRGADPDRADRRGRARRGPDRRRRLRRHQVAVLPGPLPRRRRAGGRRRVPARASRRATSHSCAAQGSCTTSAAPASRTRSGTSRVP